MTVLEYLENCSDNEIIELWNTYCETEKYSNDKCYRMYDFDEVIDTENLSFKAVHNRLDKNFNFNHQLFWWNGLDGYICSGDYSDFIDSVVDLESLAEAIEESPSYYDIDLDNEFYYWHTYVLGI